MVPFLVITGPPGVGKTTVAWEVFAQAAREGHRPAMVDIDLLGASWPSPDDDPYNERLKVLNMRTMWQNFHASGSRCLIAAGVVETREICDRYQEAVSDSHLTLCRLRAGAEELAARIGRRGREREEYVAELLDRTMELSEELEKNDIADVVVDAEDSVPHVARMIRQHWPTCP